MLDSHASDPAPRPPRRSRLLGSLGVAGLSSGGIATARYILPTFSVAIGAGPMVTGLLGSSLTLASIFLGQRFGGWIDQIGSRLPMLVALAMLTAAPLVYLLFPYPAVLIATAILAGTGAMFGHIASTKAVGDSGLPEARTRNLGYLVLVYSVAQFVCPVAAGWTFEHLGPVPGVSTIGIFGAMALIAIVLLPHNFTSSVRPDNPSTPLERHGGLSLLRIGQLRIWLFASTGFVTVQSLYPFVIALHAARIGLSPAQGGLVLGYYALGTFLSRLAAPLATSLWRSEQLIVVALLVGSAEYAFVPFAEEFASLAITSGLLGATLGIGVPLTLALVYDAAPKGAENAAVGLNTSGANLLQTLLPLVLALVTASMGIGLMLWILSAAMVALGVTIALRRP